MSGCIQPPAWRMFSVPLALPESKEEHMYGNHMRKRKSICVSWNNSPTSGNFRFVSCQKLPLCFCIPDGAALLPHPWTSRGFQHTHHAVMNSPSASFQVIWLMFSLTWPILGRWQILGDFSLSEHSRGRRLQAFSEKKFLLWHLRWSPAPSNSEP